MVFGMATMAFMYLDNTFVQISTCTRFTKQNKKKQQPPYHVAIQVEGKKLNGITIVTYKF